MGKLDGTGVNNDLSLVCFAIRSGFRLTGKGGKVR